MEWVKLVPELLCSDTARSIAFYRDVLGFKILYERPEEGFAYMDLDGASIMLERESDYWFTGKLERPYGRGVNFEIGVDDVDALCRRVKAADVTLFREIEERWYRRDDQEVGNRGDDLRPEGPELFHHRGLRLPVAGFPRAPGSPD